MEKKGIAIVVVSIVALLLVFNFLPKTKTILEHREPADISKSESGTGLSARLLDCGGRTTYSEEYCKVVEIPSWFSTKEVDNFAIIKSPAIQTCSTASSCPGYSNDPIHTMCWLGNCVLGNIDLLLLDYSITNQGSQVTFNNVQVSSASPATFNSSVNKTSVSLAPGQTKTFMMANANAMSLASWINQNITFIVNASGTSDYDNSIAKTGDMYTLGFYPNPSGSLSISIVRVT